MTAPSETDEHGPRVPIVCTACDTTARIPLEEVADTLERHNERLHDGAEIAQVDPDVVDHLADLVATEMGLLDDSS
ncbi:hypothetical protein [Natronobeatus ordinarius]|uniref:hypothetical protein n=1 Tax=Natronobeatus ordinarius TaxID=2963433 RepID=UPI0020CD083E|nr:hypothetical protein [Natronobeatus ordinarius]